MLTPLFHVCPRATPRPGPGSRLLTTGFTLLEMIIAIAILALLAGLSLPSLEGIWLRSHRTDAWLALAQLQTAQENHRSSEGAYTDNLAALGMSPHSPAGRYELSVSKAGERGFTLVATARGAQTRDAECAVLLLESTPIQVNRHSSARSGERNAEPKNRDCWGA
jgi:type IV pilus assembly protein PilE